MNKKLLIIVFGVCMFLLFFVGGYFFFAHQCPASCDDGNSCTTEICSKNTNYKCKIDSIPNCCGNKSCETGENYGACALDCPNCDDNNKCTKDSYDYHAQKCVNAPISDIVCCGNTVCEIGESYGNCARDCPNCDDDNKCTKDKYDYHGQKIINEVIIPCCGNKICDKGAETFSSCSADCLNCDDNNKLTTDSFNYKTQKCENPVTHYFFDDFENGTQGWNFLNATDAGPASPLAWTLIHEGANTVLDGTKHNFAEISGNGWDDYILKLRFKRISGSIQINFRNNFFTNEQPAHRYIIRLEEGNRLVLAKGSNESKGIYQDLQESAASFTIGWHTLEVRSYENIINVYLDGSLLIKYKDTQDPILKGKVNFETGDDEEFLFDNVEIKIIGKKDIIYP